MKTEIEGLIETCGWLSEYYDGAFDNPTELEYYKELESQLCDFDEEKVMRPYKYIIDNYVKL